MLFYKKTIASILLAMTFTGSVTFANEASNELIAINCQNEELSVYDLIAEALELDPSLALEDIIKQLRLCGGSKGGGELIEQAKFAYAEINHEMGQKASTSYSVQPIILPEETLDQATIDQASRDNIDDNPVTQPKALGKPITNDLTNNISPEQADLNTLRIPLRSSRPYIPPPPGGRVFYIPISQN